MSARVRLEPRGTTLEAEPGAPLRDLLFEHGIEFPCGGRGTCRGCRVRVLSGTAPPTPDDRRLLSAAELNAGWRLACRAEVADGLVVHIEQWDTVVLGDDRPLAAAPRDGFGIAIDVGTTTLVAQLVDLAAGRVLAVRTALNPQAAFGGDVMSRLEVALRPDGASALRQAVRGEVARMVTELCEGVAAVPVRATLVGNTPMHHLFCGLDVASLALAPYETPHGAAQRLDASSIGWPVPVDDVRFLPCIGSFVGSDVLAGIRATGLAEHGGLEVLIDLGTNAEIVVAALDRLLCASAAAGPAFEGGRISAGMRAATGAITEVSLVTGAMVPHVIGGGAARGICGSGLVDAVRCGLDLGLITTSGRAAGESRAFDVAEGVRITQADLREVQLAKAAVAAGLATLLDRVGATTADIVQVHLAGAFGNYVSAASARRIGLLPVDPGRVRSAGNTALLGAKLALFDGPDAWDALAARVRHVPLALDQRFQDAYVASMAFPSS